MLLAIWGVALEGLIHIFLKTPGYAIRNPGCYFRTVNLQFVLAFQIEDTTSS